MLRLAMDGELRHQSADGRKWLIEGRHLREKGLKAPQGFTFEISYISRLSNFFWTSNEDAAYLFYKRYGYATDEVKAEFRDRLHKETFLYSLSYSIESKTDLKCPDGMAYRSYQKAGIDYCLNTPNTLIADQQRLGKTIITLGLINNLDDINKILIVCPKTAKPIWLEEADKWLMKDYAIQVLDSKSDIDPNANIYIINYDNLHIQTRLVRMAWDIVVGDEIHLCSRERAARTKFFQALHAKRRLGLSGTPLLNNPVDFLTVLQWIDSSWKSVYIYKDKFATKSGITLNLEEVKEVARSTCMLRRLQAQAFSNEPTERRIVPLQPTEEVIELINKQLKFEDYARVSRQLGISKVPITLDHIDAYTSEGEKLVVFAWHREVINRLKASLGSKAEVIYGSSSEDEREKAKQRFNNDPTCQVMLGSIGAASMALNLSVSSHIIFAEQDWSNGLMAQAEERCSDKEQKRQVFIEYLAYPNSIDFNKLNRIQFKDDRVDKALDILY